MTFTIIVNFKHYRQSSGPDCDRMLKNLVSCKKKSGVDVYYAVGPSDLRSSVSIAPGRIIAQSVDTLSMGAYTGSLSVEFLKISGVAGSLLNHSEKRVSASTVKDLQEGTSGQKFQLYICAENLEEVRAFASMKPGFVAYEPPELIGGDISVSKAKPEIISEASAICRENHVELLVGAGVKTAGDVVRSKELGASGILIASGVVLSSDPANALNSLIEAV